MELIFGERKTVPASVGMTSLIGVGGDPPHAWGNYFELNVGNGKIPWMGIRVYNFWAENLQAARDKFLDDGMVEIISWTWSIFRKEDSTTHYLDGCIIDDERIPDNWYYNKMCFTGTYPPPLEVAQEMYSVRGDLNNEIEQFIDPVTYYARKGAHYDPKSGIIAYTLGRSGAPRKLPIVSSTLPMVEAKEKKEDDAA